MCLLDLWAFGKQSMRILTTHRSHRMGSPEAMHCLTVSYTSGVSLQVAPEHH